MSSFLEQAGSWFLRSGIQEADGGVARYYLCDAGRNAAVSTEITGYAISTLVYLHALTRDPLYLEAALKAARYLTRVAWNADASAFPFEPESDRAYFFDTGIIVRGLLAAWRATGDKEFLEGARGAALSMAFDFPGERTFHPVISLPEKQPLPYETGWSRAPGCYQLKSALAWREVEDPRAPELYQSALQRSLTEHEPFLEAEPEREKVMDRLHAYCYFLEALLPAADSAETRAILAAGLDRAAGLFREISPEFERSDVAAQLLRVRLIAHHETGLALDEAAAREEAERARSFQASPENPDPRVLGGFFFGRKQGRLLPYANPVSTGFCLQALALWEQHEAGLWRFELQQLI